MISFSQSWMLERNIQNSPKLLSFSLLSHGQADIERGFSQNKTVLQQNTKEDSISSETVIKDHKLANKLQPHFIEITNEIGNRSELQGLDMKFI